MGGYLPLAVMLYSRLNFMNLAIKNPFTVVKSFKYLVYFFLKSHITIIRINLISGCPFYEKTSSHTYIDDF